MSRRKSRPRAQDGDESGRSWERFEEIITELHRQLAPQAEVRRNHLIKGQSGRMRQLDVTISQKVGTYPLLIVVECREQGRAVSIGSVEAFSKKLQDVRAARGVMISTAGFAEGARAIALRDNILLRTYRQAREEDWRKLLGEHAWVSLMLPRFTNMSLMAVIEGGKVVSVSPQALVVALDQPHEAQTVRWLFDQCIWPVLSQQRRLGNYDWYLNVLERKLGIQLEELVPLERIVIRGTWTMVRHVINLRLDSGDVLESMKGGPVCTRLVSESFEWADVLERSPGVSLTQEEYDRMLADPKAMRFPLNLATTAKYLRLDIQARNDDRGSE